jgi:hypothetical protein
MTSGGKTASEKSFIAVNSSKRANAGDEAGFQRETGGQEGPTYPSLAGTASPPIRTANALIRSLAAGCRSV